MSTSPKLLCELVKQDQSGDQELMHIVMIHKQLYGAHPALNEFSLTTLFPMAAALTVNNINGWTTQVMLTTGDLSWLEAGAIKEEVIYNHETDIKGPLTIGLSLERELNGQGENKTILSIVLS